MNIRLCFFLGALSFVLLAMTAECERSSRRQGRMQGG